MTEVAMLGINASEARKEAVQAAVIGLTGVEKAEQMFRQKDSPLSIYTLVVTVAPERALQLIQEIEKIRGVEGVYSIQQQNENEAGSQIE